MKYEHIRKELGFSSDELHQERNVLFDRDLQSLYDPLLLTGTPLGPLCVDFDYKLQFVDELVPFRDRVHRHNCLLKPEQ